MQSKTLLFLALLGLTLSAQVTAAADVEGLHGLSGADVTGVALGRRQLKGTGTIDVSGSKGDITFEVSKDSSGLVSGTITTPKGTVDFSKNVGSLRVRKTRP